MLNPYSLIEQTLEMTRNSTSIISRSWYSNTLSDFVLDSDDRILAELLRKSEFDVQQNQKNAWLAEIPALKQALGSHSGNIYLEFTIPRMGHRVDAIVLINGIVLVIEFKVGASRHYLSDMDQTYDYVLDLKYFHEGSHQQPVVPILVATHSKSNVISITPHNRISGLFQTICTNSTDLGTVINKVVLELHSRNIDPSSWESARYCPTPTIIEAARALYAGHNVSDISRNDAGAINLTETSDRLSEIIEGTKARGEKAICFITGVPGAGKTLVGLNIATRYNDAESDLHSIFLSGNGPLVDILREALARDHIRRENNLGKRLRKPEAMARVKAFIQNVHHFRDDCLRDNLRPPADHVALFDEAQRAWDLEHTVSWMRRKKKNDDFQSSESEFLISCMDRRSDWSVIVCLVGGGQEIHTGEAGIREWLEALKRSYHNWNLYISPALTESEYKANTVLDTMQDLSNIHYEPKLHLAVSMRSFRSEKVSEFVKTVLDCETIRATDLLRELKDRYPIVLTRNLDTARQWLRNQASGSERYGIVVSSQAERLKPYSIDVRTPVKPIKWFLDGKEDVRSSYYLEDVATEFNVQGLELDWACVSWDGDFRYHENGWKHFSFRGTKWQKILKDSRKVYLKNAYRVLLTRARQGMIVFIPEGSTNDPTRDPSYYNPTFNYLKSIGLPVI
jgi:hypothetical protein